MSTPSSRARHYLMCPPEHFEVSYAINPWMDPSGEVDCELAQEQWSSLKDLYEKLGHTVDIIEPIEGLPDMVFAANGGLVVGDQALGARFAYPERQAEGPAYLEWFQEHQLDVRAPLHVNEGEGDFLVVGNLVLAGTGFRTDAGAHAEVQDTFNLPVVSLVLIDPKFYHLDTALAALSDTDIAYLPTAFSEESRDVLERLFPDAIHVSEKDAMVLGLNAVSDGANVIVPAQAEDFAAQLRERGYTPHPVDLSELLKAGGSVKCCTLELHQRRSST